MLCGSGAMESGTQDASRHSVTYCSYSRQCSHGLPNKHSCLRPRRDVRSLPQRWTLPDVARCCRHSIRLETHAATSRNRRQSRSRLAPSCASPWPVRRRSSTRPGPATPCTPRRTSMCPRVRRKLARLRMDGRQCESACSLRAKATRSTDFVPERFQQRTRRVAVGLRSSINGSSHPCAHTTCERSA